MALGEGGEQNEDEMEYTDYCPNCDQQLTIEEFPGNVTFKYNGKPTRKCPKCGMKLEIVEGQVSVIKEEDDTV